MPGLFRQVADDNAASGGQMGVRLAERRDASTGAGDETVTAIREDDHIEAAGQCDVFKKAFDDIRAQTALLEVVLGRGDRAARGLHTHHAISLIDKRDEISARSGPDEQDVVIRLEESGKQFFFPAHQPRRNVRVAGTEMLP
jgi:hypothetical protein